MWWRAHGYRPTRFFYPGDPPGNPPADPPDDPDDPLPFTPITSQDDFDRMIADRIKRAEKKARDDAAAATRTQIETEAATKRQQEQGEFEKLYTAEQGKVAGLQQQIEDLKAEAEQRELDALKAAAAAKYGLPAELAARLTGTDSATIDADAKALAKTMHVRPPDTEAGAGRKAVGKSRGVESGGYTFGQATRTVPFPDRRPRGDD